jgi:hypothetical protein
MRPATLLAVLLMLSSAGALMAEDLTTEIAIYGGTPGGIAAALAAGRAGKQVVLDSEGLPISADAEGKELVRSSHEGPAKADGKPVTLESVVSYLRATLARMKAMQPAAKAQAGAVAAKPRSFHSSRRPNRRS